MQLANTPRSAQAGSRLDAAAVIQRFEEAGRTLLCLPSSGTYPAQLRAAWPDIVRDASEAYGWESTKLRRPVPSPGAIDRMDITLGWASLIPLEPRPGQMVGSRHGGAIVRRIVLMRALVSPYTDRHLWSWRKIAAEIGCSHQAAPNWHAQGIDRIVAGLARSPSVSGHPIAGPG